MPNYINRVFSRIQPDCNVSRKANHVINDYGYDLISIINFCGGIPCHVTNFELDADVDDNSDCKIAVEIKCDEFELVRIINFESRHVYNFKMEVSFAYRGMHIGTNLFLNQVLALKNRFNYMWLYAAGSHEFTIYDGYYKWGRVGYFQNHLSHKDFQKWLFENDLEPCSLHEFLIDDDNYQIWQLRGRSWNGSFQLNDNSPNMNYLRQYLKRKGITVSI